MGGGQSDKISGRGRLDQRDRRSDTKRISASESRWQSRTDHLIAQPILVLRGVQRGRSWRMPPATTMAAPAAHAHIDFDMKVVLPNAHLFVEIEISWRWSSDGSLPVRLRLC